MRAISRSITCYLFFVAAALLPAGASLAAISPVARGMQQDTSEAVYVRLFLDSIKNAEGTFQQVEARVTGGEIISVYVAGKEVPETEYEIYTPHLTELLAREKELKNELFSLMNRITAEKNILDSLLQKPLYYKGQTFYPDQDMREQLLAFLKNESPEPVPPQDSLSADSEMPEQEEFMKIMDDLQHIRKVREENATLHKETIGMLEQEEGRLREQLEEINDQFTTEKIAFSDDQKNIKPEHTKKKKGKRKRKNSRKVKKHKSDS
jgi:hypothetical protein